MDAITATLPLRGPPQAPACQASRPGEGEHVVTLLIDVQQLFTLLRHYDYAHQEMAQATRELTTLLRAIVAQQPCPPVVLQWLKSQPFALLGILIPPQVLEQIAVLPQSAQEAPDALSSCT
mgnify:CR=1 FL=1